jgi:NDP-sugar pyrophosphorylase family protein
MAGAGSRFAKAGYKAPKPLIPIHGIPMIKVVIENLKPSQPHRFIFIAQCSHISEYGLEEKLKLWAPGSVLIQIDGLTEGAACTVLKAKELINTSNALMIANSDQYVDMSIDDYLDVMSNKNLDGLIMTMTASDPKWSFVGLSSEQLVTTVVEKEVISNEATVGIYNFQHGSDFVRATELMIEKNMRVNDEFYVAPAYNQLIAEGQKIGIHNVGSEGAGMYGLGIPTDLDLFLGLPLSKVNRAL